MTPTAHMDVTWLMIFAAQKRQGIQRIGSHSDSGEPRTDDVLVFYADHHEDVRQQLQDALDARTPA